MKSFFIFCLLCLSCAANAAAQTGAIATASEIIQTENAFAEAARAKSAKTAFLEFGAANAVIFDFQPENNREFWQKREEPDYLLSWKPAWIDVSASGNLALSTGHSSFSPTRNVAPVSFGEFATIWKKQPDNRWKFVLDIGVEHEQIDVGNARWQSARLKTNEFQTVKADEWQTVEQLFYETLRANRAFGAYRQLAADNIRLVRNGLLPFVGKEAVLKHFAAPNVTLKNKVLGGEADSDFIYTYGRYEMSAADGKSEKGFFLRVWKFEKKNWRVAFDLERPLSPENN